MTARTATVTVRTATVTARPALWRFAPRHATASTAAAHVGAASLGWEA